MYFKIHLSQWQWPSYLWWTPSITTRIFSKRSFYRKKIYFDLFRRRGYVVNANGRVKPHYFIADVKRFIEVNPSGHILLCSNNSLHFRFCFAKPTILMKLEKHVPWLRIGNFRRNFLSAKLGREFYVFA